MTATIIAFEGIDGSGKGTQSRLLAESLRSRGLRVALLSFPRYSETRFGGAIGDFLNGRFGALEQVSPWLVSVLYAGDRFESKSVLDDAIADADVLVLDRYTASNIAHQGARVDAADREEIVTWIEGVEHGVFGLPRADLTLLLDVSVETSQDLIRRKDARDYTDQAADLQESNVPYMTGVRAFYLELARRPDWRIVRCEASGDAAGGRYAADGLRAVEVIAAEVADLVSNVVSP